MNSAPVKNTQSINVEFINPFILQVLHVFQTMLGWNLVRQEVFTKQTFLPAHEVSGVVHLEGEVTGTVVISFSRDLACRMLGELIEARMVTINAEVADLVGEFTNIIAGRAIAQLANYQIRNLPPEVVVGRTRTIDYPSRVSKILVVEFESPDGILSLEAGLYRPENFQSLDKVCTAKSSPQMVN